MKKFLCVFLSAVIAFCNFSYGMLTANANSSELYINEICARNTSLADGSGLYPDWLELYNGSNDDINLDGFYLSDSAKKPLKYKLPSVTLKAKAFIIFYCDKKPSTAKNDEYYTSFKISGDGETVYLSDGETVIDKVSTPALKAEEAYSRIPDGSSSWYKSTTTPGSSNSAAAFKPSAPVFSAKSGFYDNEFDISIYADDGLSIYYTTDCSAPTEDSIPYTQPIHISDASENENVYSSRTDLSTQLNHEDIEKYLGMERFADVDNSSNCTYVNPPKEKVDKCTVIRAICIDGNGNKSEITNASYFVGHSDDEEYQNIEILSVIADPYDLFDYENGLYVTGRDYDEYKATYLDGGADASFKKYYWWWNANYYRNVSCESYVDYFDSDLSFVGGETLGFSIKGSSSRGMVQKGFNLTAEKEYGASSTTKNHYMYSDKKEKGISVTACGNDYIYKTADYIGLKLSSGLNLTCADMKPVQVFIDGEYFGFYYITERIFGKTYFKENYNLDTDNLSVIKTNTLKEGTQEDLENLINIENYILGSDMSDDAVYGKVCESIDIDSIIDYLCIETFIGRNNDWPGGNWGFWKCNDSKNNEYGDGKWRTLLYDLNSGAYGEIGDRNYDKNINSIRYICEGKSFFGGFFCNKQFREKYKKRYYELVKTNFSDENISSILDNDLNTVRPFINSNNQRFFNNEVNLTNYDNRIAKIRDFFDGRAETTCRQMEELFAEYDKKDSSKQNFTDSTTSQATTAVLNTDNISDNSAVTVRQSAASTDSIVSDLYSEQTTKTYEENSSSKNTAPPNAVKKNGVWINEKQKNTKIKKLKSGKGSITVIWNKIKGIKGYQIQLSTNKKFKKNNKTITVNKQKTTEKTIKKLKTGKKYYIRIRTYKTVMLNGKKVKVYSKWSKSKAIKAK